MNVCAGGVEGSLLGIIAFHGELAEAIKEGIVCYPLLLRAGLNVASSQTCLERTKNLFL